MFQKILVPVDLTDEPNCRLAIAGVQQLNKADVASVRVITVLPGGDTFMSEYISEDIFAKATADATHELQQFSEKIRAEGKEVSLVVRHGNVYDEVLLGAADALLRACPLRWLRSASDRFEAVTGLEPRRLDDRAL
jgi:nucleotide-binding universal stress UspA family protein